MSNQASIDNTYVAAIEMYRRLRQNGQTSPLARISVESRYTTLTTDQRHLLRQMIANTEANIANQRFDQLPAV
ncbi:MAG: hypothetical protein KF716_17060 [Anaerolineae bacterium]|nr:hypothetical protein [Anaerolineae bacterium]